MDQLLFDELQRTGNLAVSALTIGQVDGVAQERDTCLGRLTEIVHSFIGDDHVRLERHLVDIDIAYALEDTVQIGCPASIVTNREGGINKRTIREGAQEGDGVEQVRLADTVGPGDTGERAEAHVNVDQILEARNFEAR